jgi:hypothetical protein
MKHVQTSFGPKPCPTCGGSGEVAGGSCSTCKHKGGMVENLLNVSLIAPNEVYCRLLKRTVDPSGCGSWEA